MTAPVGKKYLNVAVNAKVYDRVQALAKAAGMPAGTFATLLFEAAYAARCGETGDVALDTAVSRVALLFGTGFDVTSICQATGLSAGFVERTTEAWRAEMRRGQTADARVGR